VNRFGKLKKISGKKRACVSFKQMLNYAGEEEYEPHEFRIKPSVKAPYLALVKKKER